jgi:hypothetical protein
MKMKNLQPRTPAWNSRTAMVLLAVGAVGAAAYREARPSSAASERQASVEETLRQAESPRNLRFAPRAQ